MEDKKNNPTCLEVALERLEERAIRESTYRSYLRTLKTLELEDFPFEKISTRVLNQKLQTVLNESTRRKHAINLRACLGVKVPTPRVRQKDYGELPSVADLHETFKDSRYRLFAFQMLYGGARVGETLVKQVVKGNVISFDKQKTPRYEILPAKSIGPVVVPSWFADEYRQSEEKDFQKQHYTIYAGIVRRSVKMLGIPCNPHMLRHAFATHLMDLGASPRVLQAQMRHSNVTISLGYYVHTRSQDVADLMNRFGGAS